MGQPLDVRSQMNSYVVSIQSIVPTDFISNSSEDPGAPPIALSTSGARREQDLSHERRLVRWQKNG